MVLIFAPFTVYLRPQIQQPEKKNVFTSQLSLENQYLFSGFKKKRKNDCLVGEYCIPHPVPYIAFISRCFCNLFQCDASKYFCGNRKYNSFQQFQGEIQMQKNPDENNRICNSPWFQIPFQEHEDISMLWFIGELLWALLAEYRDTHMVLPDDGSCMGQWYNWLMNRWIATPLLFAMWTFLSYLFWGIVIIKLIINTDFVPYLHVWIFSWSNVLYAKLTRFVPFNIKSHRMGLILNAVLIYMYT